MNVDDAVAKLKTYLQKNPQRLKEEREVIQRFSSIFSPEVLDQLTKEQFKSFLLIKNNRHWEGIHRQGNMITENMPRLRKALKTLLDEKTDLKERLNRLFPKNRPNFIKGLGRAIVTPILMIVYPEKYGVYNKRSEAGLKELRMYPKSRGESFAERYVKINSVLTRLAKQYDVSLFQLDDMFGFMSEHGEDGQDDEESRHVHPGGEATESEIRFGLEKHLEDFLVHNWGKTSLGRRLEIFQEDGDIAQQYDTGVVGRIDILARDRKTKDWVVIELKKGQDSDKVVGQALRYMGWVTESKATGKEKVSGIIITGSTDERIRYALKAASNIEHLIYDVKFNLRSTR